MNWLTRDNIISLTVEMVKQASISGTEQEAEMSNKIVEIIKRIDYFKENPEYVYQIPLENDSLERSFVAALLKGKTSSRKTLIFMGHMDVVDILDYGELQEYAFDPIRLTEKLKDYSLPEEAREDLLSGNYLFGRGVSDMKAGQALQLSLLQYYSKLDNFDGNIIFLSVPDEETSSKGIINTIPFLNQLKEKHNLDYQVVIDCEPTFPNYPGDKNNYIYTGSIGKSLAGFYFQGKETHVGDVLSGLNGNLLASEVTRLLEGNLDFCEEIGDITSPPPTCLKQKDLKRLYSAQIPHNAISYFNLPVINSNPEEILTKLKELSITGFKNALARINKAREVYFKQNDIEFLPLDWDPKVYTFAEFYQEVYNSIGGKVDKIIENTFKENKADLEQQQLGLKIIEKLQEISPDKDPKIIIAYLPPYYPAVATTGSNEKEEKILEIVDQIIDLSKKKYKTDLGISQCFTGISDLSYFNIMEYEKAVDYLKPNMPNWGLDYQLPLKEINELGVPVLNLGVYGKDAHKYHERVELNYSFKILPELLKFAVEKILS